MFKNISFHTYFILCPTHLHVHKSQPTITYVCITRIYIDTYNVHCAYMKFYETPQHVLA